MSNINNDDIEVLNVNKNIINNEKYDGFKIEKSKMAMYLKKIPANIYKLLVLLVAIVTEVIPEFASKVPGLNYAIDFIAGYGKNLISQVASDEFFDNIICKIFNIEVNFASPEYCQAYVEFTHHEGKYFQISMIIKAIATFAVEHPGLVLAGGAALIGLVYKAISAILKKYANAMRYNDMTDKQKNIYRLIKDILKERRKIKKVDNGDILVSDLNISYEIIDNLSNYPRMLNRVHKILLKLKEAVTEKNEVLYEQYRIELEKCVLNFERRNNYYLNDEMDLVVGKYLVKKKV